MNRIFTIFFLSLCVFSTKTLAADYFWVGGTGNWSELSHWATTSGGATKHTILPTAADDVYFDANSFSTTGQSVSINVEASCRNMNWTGVTFSPTISAFFGVLNIHGSLTVPSSVGRSFIGDIYFKSTSPGNTVSFGNKALSSNENGVKLYFEGIGGGWSFQDSISVERIFLKAGSLNTNGKAVNCNYFDVSGTATRSLIASTSDIYCNYWVAPTTAGLTLNPASSQIICAFQFTGGGLTYNNLTIPTTTTVAGNNAFNTITLSDGAVLKLTAGSTQTISNLVSNGTASSPANIKSSVVGSTATLSKSSGSITINFAKIQDNVATGGATFTATNSNDLGNNTGWVIPIISPTTQSSSIFMLSLVQNSASLNFTKGNGTNRIIVARQGSTVNSAPVDGSAYTAGVFGSGSQIGTGNYVVYNGNEEKATISGLAVNTLYYFSIYEYNGSGASSDYLTTSPATKSFTTLPANAVVMSSSNHVICSGKYYASGGLYYYNNNENLTHTLTPATVGTKLRLSFSAFYTSGSGDVLSIYDGANTSAPLIGSWSENNAPGTVTATNSAGQLTVKFVSDNYITSTGWEADISCTVLDTEPSTSASAVTFSNVSNTSLTLSWTPGNGSKRVIFARQNATVGFVPVDGATYSGAAFGGGASVGNGTYAVFSGTGNTATVTGLIPGSTYYFSIFEYNGANTSSNYRATGTAASKATITIAAEPTTAPTNVSISYLTSSSLRVTWVNGNGTKRVVVAKQGSPVNALPVDGAEYVTSGFATATDLGGGNKVIYSGSGNLTNIVDLTPETGYHFAVFEFNGSGSTTNYLTSAKGVSSTTTYAAEPTVISNIFSMKQKGFTSLKWKWTNGNGAKRIVVLSEVGNNNIEIRDGVDYLADSKFGLGASVGSKAYVVYNGVADSVLITGLLSNTSYIINVYEYNGNGITINYNSSAYSSHSTTLRGRPAIQSSDLVSSEVTSQSAKLNWLKGDGTGRIVVAKENAPVDAVLRDSTLVNIYGSNYGEGTNLGNGNNVVYKGNSDSVIVNKLNPSSTYYFSVVEYNDENNYLYYSQTNNPSVSVTTLAGKNYYWVGGKGKWSDLSHWATTSGGSTTHASLPSSADNVYFNEHSFTNKNDTVQLDVALASVKTMDWSAINTKTNFVSTSVSGSKCSNSLHVFGSFYLSDSLTIDIGEVQFRAATKGNTINMANKTGFTRSCNAMVTFNGFGGEWNLVGKLNVWSFNFQGGKLVAQNTTLSLAHIRVNSGNIERVLDLTNSEVDISSLDLNANTIIKGGTFNIRSSAAHATLKTNGASLNKVVLNNTGYITEFYGGASIDTLDFNPGVELKFESGKTFTIRNLQFTGDSTIRTTIRATKLGSPAIFYKESGSIDLSHVMIYDNHAQGGAQFNAAKSVGTNISGWNFTNPTLFAPNKSSNSIDIVRVYTTSFKVKWKVGNGVKRLVIAREGAPVNVIPTNGQRYLADTEYGKGASLDNGNFVLYNGALDSIFVTGLTPGKKYHFSIFEFNEWNNSTMYKVSAPAKGLVEMHNTSDIMISNSAVTTCSAKFFDEGGRGYYDKSKSFTQTISPATVGSKLAVLFTKWSPASSDNLSIYDGASTTDPLIGTFNSSNKPLQAIVAQNASGKLTFKFQSLGYHTQEYLVGWEAELFCVGTLASEPTLPNSLSVKSKTGESITLLMTKGNGAGRVVIAKAQNAVDKSPVDGADFAANSIFGEGTHFGNGNYLVYSGIGDTVKVTGLRGNTAYHFAAFEYNGGGSTINHLTSANSNAKDTTLVTTPTIASSDLNFRWVTSNSIDLYYSRGDGENVLVLARKQGEITFVPRDGEVYQHNNSFKSGLNFGNDTYAIYYGPNATASAYSLDQLSSYTFKVFEANGKGKNTKYLTTSELTGKQSTSGPSVTIKTVEAEYCPNGEIQVPFNLEGTFYGGNTITLQISAADGSFNVPVILGDTTAIFNGKIVANLPDLVGGFYKIRIVSSSPRVFSDTKTIKIPDLEGITASVSDSTFTASESEGIQWFLNGNPIQGATAQAYKYNTHGVYTVRRFQDGCWRTSEPIVITGIEDEVFAENVKVYPNPGEKEITIEYPFAGKGGTYKVYDLKGRQLMEGGLSDQLDKKVKVNVTGLTSGVYQIHIRQNNYSVQKLFIKK